VPAAVRVVPESATHVKDEDRYCDRRTPSGTRATAAVAATPPMTLIVDQWRELESS
jgi:hypothetical protein